MIQKSFDTIKTLAMPDTKSMSQKPLHFVAFINDKVPIPPENGPRFQASYLSGFLVYAVFSPFFFTLSNPLIASPQAVGEPGGQFGSLFAPTPGLDQDKIREGWISLFDGQTLFGWQAASQADWRVEEGEIRVSSGEKGLLRTTAQFDDYELLLEFKSAARTNSGVFLRTNPRPRNVIRDCYELNIASRLDHKFPTGSLVNRATCETDFAADRWHQIRVLADGAFVKVWIDDKKTVEYVDPQPLGRGFIGLQFNSGSISFRNIRLKPINVPAIEISAAFEDWNTDQSLASEFIVTDQNELLVKGGRGQIETKKQFADFVFSMLCRTNAEGLNSGVFFRCLPNELMNGYESQIQNQFKDSDRTQPVDCGTGGIFRRANARHVNANDNEWFAKTIIATGPHVSVWVNGYQVTDWSDQRSPNDNPRKGRRLAQGTIILQGHDPTTDILFKNIRVRELSPRGK